MPLRQTTFLARIRRPLVVIVVVLAALAGAYLLWLRDLSAFRIQQLRMVGLTMSQAPEIEADFERAGRRMTSLHLDRGLLERVAARYPVIRSFSAEARFPDGLRIDVRERQPGAMLEDRAGRQVPVAADGVVLEGVEASRLAVIEVDALPQGDRLSDAGGLSAIRITAAAPPPLSTAIEQVEAVAEGPTEVLLRGGVRVVFGDERAVGQKWAAVAAALADASSEGISYIDVTLPDRPVAGGLGSGAGKP